jgi:Predicted nucleotidyltransferases
MLPERIKKEFIQMLIAKLNPYFVILHGSFAKGAIREDSDIDIAYFSDTRLSAYERFMLANELAGIAGREVDVTDIRDADTVFAMQIFAYGIPLHVRDENEFAGQRMRAYSMYAAFNEQRAPILEAIKERGSVLEHE